MKLKNIAKILALGACLAFGYNSAKAQSTAFVEETVELQNNTPAFYHWADVSTGKNAARVLVIQTADKTEASYGAKQAFEFGKLKGDGELIGFSNSQENYGAGINARGWPVAWLAQNPSPLKRRSVHS